MKKLLLVILLVLLSTDCSAVTRTISSIDDLASVNAAVQPGDLVYIRGGDYAPLTEFIKPARSGTASNKITYMAYPGETVNVTMNRIPNSDMESSAWASYGGATVTHESGIVYDGSYSTKFTVSGGYQGVVSQPFNTGNSGGTGYRGAFWIYSTRDKINIEVTSNAGVLIGSYAVTIPTNEWYLYMVTGWLTSAQTNVQIKFRSPETYTYGTWYIDDIELYCHNPSAAIYLSNVDYIVVDGINISRYGKGIFIRNGADYNEIKNCTITDGCAELYYAANIIDNEGGSPSTYNWIHDNTILRAGSVHKTGASSDCPSGIECTDDGDVFRIGAVASDESNYNVVEDNEIAYGGHTVISIYTDYNVIRNNFIHNEPWITRHWTGCVALTSPCEYNQPLEGHGNRCIVTEAGQGHHNLIEGNRLGKTGTPSDDDGSSGIEFTSDYELIRYNVIYSCATSGIYFKGQGGAPDYCRINNNTIYYTGRGTDISIRYQSGIHLRGLGSPHGNEFRNNLIYLCDSSDYSCGGAGCDEDLMFVDNTFDWAKNWTTGNGNPEFVNNDLGDPTSDSVPDLSLQSTSGARNHGVPLTTVAYTDISYGTQLRVEDATWFQYGDRGVPGLTSPDWIAVGSVDNTVRISSINYTTNTITLANSINRSDGENVWLYKKSDGEVVLLESDPDSGALEYVSGVVDISRPYISGNPYTSGDEDGMYVHIPFNEPMRVGSNGPGYMTLTVNDILNPLTFYGISSDLRTVTYSLNKIVYLGDILKLFYTDPTNGLEDNPAGNDLDDFSNVVVTNNSTLTEIKPEYITSYVTYDGKWLVINYDIAVQIGVGGSGGFVSAVDGFPSFLTYEYGHLDTFLVYSFDNTVVREVPVYLSYVQPVGGNGVEGEDGTDVDNLSNVLVDNRSEVLPPETPIPDTTPPALTDLYIVTTGQYAVAIFDENLKFDSVETGLLFTATEGPLGITYIYSDAKGASNFILVAFDRIVYGYEDVEFNYTPPGGGLRDINNNYVTTISGYTVDNQSTKVLSPSTIIGITSGIETSSGSGANVIIND